MHWKKGLHRFEFHNQSSFDQQIKTKPEVQFPSTVINGHPFLGFDADSHHCQFIGQAGLVTVSNRPGPAQEWTRKAASSTFRERDSNSEGMIIRCLPMAEGKASNVPSLTLYNLWTPTNA